MKAIHKYGNCWKKIERYVKTRSRLQIRSHCQKYYESLRANAIEDAKKRHGKGPFAVYYAYRNITYDCVPTTKIDCDIDMETFKKQLKEHSGTTKKVEQISEIDRVSSNVKTLNEGIIQEVNCELDLDEILNTGKLNESSVIQGSEFAKYDDQFLMNNEFDIFSLASKMGYCWQDEEGESFPVKSLTRIKYEI